MVTLYHHTCTHRAEMIDAGGGVLEPYPQPLLQYTPLLWMTPMAAPARTLLALSSHLLQCDRTAATYRIDAPVDAMSWAAARVQLPRVGVMRLEAARGSKPALWWVATAAQHAVRVR